MCCWGTHLATPQRRDRASALKMSLTSALDRKAWMIHCLGEEPPQGACFQLRSCGLCCMGLGVQNKLGSCPHHLAPWEISNTFPPLSFPFFLRASCTYSHLLLGTLWSRDPILSCLSLSTAHQAAFGSPDAFLRAVTHRCDWTAALLYALMLITTGPASPWQLSYVSHL